MEPTEVQLREQEAIIDDCAYEDDLYDEQLPDVCGAVHTQAMECCSTRTIKRRLPITAWLPEYELNFLVDDFVAGLTVGLTTIPQAIAYGTVAGLSPEYGLYSAFMGCFVYIFFGSCKDTTVGPTAIMSLMIKEHVASNADFAVLSCFLSGCIILLLGILNLGVLVRFISVPVTSAFATAAAITIASGQINNLFGISSPSNEFLSSWIHFFGHIQETRRNDAILGVCTLVMLLLMRKIKDIRCRFRKLGKYVALSRNALAVLIGILLCYFLSHDGYFAFRVNGNIPSGIPPFRPPPFSTTVNGEELGFGQMAAALGSSIAAIPLISILESVAVAKAFSRGKLVDATQEMIALGLCNICSSFFLSMPITGSFTRTAINNASGVRTTLGGAVTGALVLLTLALLTTTFSYIPKASLAAIIIAAMIFMVEHERVVEIWRAKKRDLLPFIVTLLTCLFWSLEYGMVCGIAFNMLFILYKSMKPKITLEKSKLNGTEACIVQFKGTLDYAAAEYLKTEIISYVTAQNRNTKLVVVNGSEVASIDFTVAVNLCSLCEDLDLLHCQLIYWNWSIATAGVVCRLHKDALKLFKWTEDLEKLELTEQTQIATITNDNVTTLPIC